MKSSKLGMLATAVLGLGASMGLATGAAKELEAAASQIKPKPRKRSKPVPRRPYTYGIGNRTDFVMKNAPDPMTRQVRRQIERYQARAARAGLKEAVRNGRGTPPPADWREQLPPKQDVAA